MSRVRGSPPAGSLSAPAGQRSTGVLGPTCTGIVTYEVSTPSSVADSPSITCTVIAPGPT